VLPGNSSRVGWFAHAKVCHVLLCWQQPGQGMQPSHDGPCHTTSHQLTNTTALDSLCLLLSAELIRIANLIATEQCGNITITCSVRKTVCRHYMIGTATTANCSNNSCCRMTCTRQLQAPTCGLLGSPS
jgi:hypothetical protein